ncbi:MAG: STING domain-containing protein [Saprospiraceae bacterium]|nr:STING domain-containing protein [Saprospiraceae bacterium]
MSIKPTLFIGSSKEGAAIAHLVKKHLSHFADCTVWDESGVFPPNENFLVSLNNALSLYEYGVLVATADDKKISRKKQTESARDNVIFEFGLFMGRLGKQKAFLIKEKSIVPPSDLFGISIPEFTDQNPPDIEQQIQACCQTIIAHIQSRNGLFDGGIYPSIPLAYGYFTNSILPAIKQLEEKGKLVRAAGKEMELRSYKFSILIPDDLRHDMKDKVTVKKNREKWIQLEIPTSNTRSYNFYIVESDWGNPDLTIYDIPTTLNALHQAIKEFVGSTSLGRTQGEDIVEKREIRSFQRVLDAQINEHPFTEGLVDTEIVDI